MLNLDIIASNLRRLRTEKSLSMEQVATLLNMTRQAYNKYELSQKTIPTGKLLFLSNYYNVSTDEILGNPLTIGRPKALEFITFEYCNSDIIDVDNTVLSTENDTKFIVTDPNENKIFIFGTSNHNVEGCKMLFMYHDNKYISRILKTENEDCIFYKSDGTPVIIRKRYLNSLIILGTMLFEINPLYDYFEIL